MTLYRETPCPHGYLSEPGHVQNGWDSRKPDGTPPEGKPPNHFCPGGSRTEVTIDIEAAIAKHNELYPVPLSARGEEWLRQIVAAALTPGDPDNGECDVTDCDRPATGCVVGEAGDLWLCREHAALTPGDTE